MVAHARKRVGQFLLEHVPEHLSHQRLHERGDLLQREEAGLDVELGELGLAVGAQVLIAEAAHDLVVAVEAAHHEQLLEDLRRLRQREELARVGAARHQVVARALRCRLGQHRRLDVDEALGVEERAHRARDRVALAQPLAHELAPQVEIAVAQPHFLADRFVELERQRVGAVQDREFAGHDLDLAGGQVGVDGAHGPRAHRACDTHHEFVAELLGVGEQRRSVRVAHDLHQALAIAQVDEDHAAVIAPPVHPTGYGDRLPDEAGGHLSAVMCAHAAISGKTGRAMLRLAA